MPTLNNNILEVTIPGTREFANKVAGEVVQVSGVGLSNEVWGRLKF